MLNNPLKYAEFEVEQIEKITKDRHVYLTKVFLHLKRGRQQSLALFFDNLDRRSEEIQEEAFMKSSAIARDWMCLVFVCLRPVTYYKSQANGNLDTIAPITFTVGHPNLSLVLKKDLNMQRILQMEERLTKFILKVHQLKEHHSFFPL